MQRKDVTDPEVIAYAKEHEIYTNEAVRVLCGEITLEEALQIRDEFNHLVETGEIKCFSNSR